MKTTCASVILAAALSTSAFGSGMLIPKEEGLPALAIKHQRVDIRIKDGVASTHVEQVFKNSVDRDLEAIYVFPLPEGAAISDFAMMINGKRMSGELVEKDKARGIYQDIVRRMKDPALLEYLSGQLFRVSVYPVPKNGEQKIELSYDQTLAFDGGLYKLVYPLKTGDKASRTLEDFSVRATLVSSQPIKTLYSPSHDVGITRKGEYEAVLGFEQDKSVLDRDFVLYYGLSKKDFGVNLLTHARPGEDGYFMMMLAPAVEPPKGEVIQRDVTFVFDTSGSMAGEKIRQARDALAFCINKLNDGDRFSIVRFSTDVETFRKDPVPVNAENRKAALAFAEGLEARGGTDIAGALAQALGAEHAAERPHAVVFLTDGKPTVGETETEPILKAVKAARKAGARIFVFGVGLEVNTALLDRLAGENGGVAQYVEPEENIEVKVSAFYDKMSRPVLAAPKLAIDKIDTRLVYPQELPDLFAGNQLLVLGRYKGDGHVAIRLTGEVNGKPQEHVFEATFQKAEPANEFIPRLWAMRRVGYLLDQIRLHGEDKELKDEVLRLSHEFGIMTPYTSYLILEKDEDYKANGISMDRLMKQVEAATELHYDAASAWAHRPAKTAAAPSAAPAAPAAEAAPQPAPVPMFMDLDGNGAADTQGARGKLGAGGGRVGGWPSTGAEAKEGRVREYLGEQSGRSAVRRSEAIDAYKSATVAEPGGAAGPTLMRTVDRRIFYLVEGVWKDRDYKPGMKEQRVKYASDEYFALLDKRPELRKCFALGEKVIVCLDAETAVVVE